MAEPRARGAVASVELLKFGSPTRREPGLDSNFTATTAPQLMLTNNPNRLRWIVQNRGASRVFLWWTPAVSSSLGFVVEPDGGSIQLLYEEDGEAVFQGIYAVAAAGNVALTVDAIEVRS